MTDIFVVLKDEMDDSDLLELDLEDIDIPQRTRPPPRNEYPEVINVVGGGDHSLYCIDDSSNDSNVGCSTTTTNKISKLNLNSNSSNSVEKNQNNQSGSTDYDIEEIEEVMANFDRHGNNSSPDIKPLGHSRVTKTVKTPTTTKHNDDFDESLYKDMPETESDIPVGLDPTTVALNKLAKEHEVII